VVEHRAVRDDVARLAQRGEVGQMLGLDAIDRRLVVLGRVDRPPQDDQLERLEIHVR
jgi:hypothetical protein